MFFRADVNRRLKQMRVNSITANNITTTQATLAFSGLMPELKAVDNKLSDRSTRLIKKMGDLIEDCWTGIRKGKVSMTSPQYRAITSNNEFVTVKPVYQGYKKLILMEIEDEKYCDRILINSAKPQEFTYERSVITPYGTAGLKSYNSAVENNEELNTRVDRRVRDIFSKILLLPDRDTKGFFRRSELR